MEQKQSQLDGISSCPFCGSSAIEIMTVSSDSGENIHYLVCGECGARGPRIRPVQSDMSDM